MPLGIPLESDYFRSTQALNDRDILPYIVYRQGNYYKLPYLSTMLSRMENHDKQQFEGYYFDFPGIVGTVSSTATTFQNSNEIAVVTLTGTAEENVFITDAVVYDENSGTTSKVVAKSGNTVTLVFLASKTPGATAFNTTADFATGNKLVMGNNSPGLRNSKLTQGNYRLPERTIYPIQHFRKNTTMNKVDFITKNRITMKGPDGTQWLAWKQVNQMVEDFNMGILKAMYSNNARYSDTSPDDNQMYSIPGQIKNLGGTYSSITAPITLTDINNMIDAMKVKNAGDSFIVAAGYGYRGTFQKAGVSQLLQYVGKNNTVGGQSVEGISFDEYKYNGISIKFIESFNDFNIPNMFPAASSLGGTKANNSALWFDESQVMTSDGMKPFITNHTFKQEGDPDTVYKVISNGLIGEKGQYVDRPTGGEMGVSYSIFTQLATILTDPTKHGYHECTI